jgi:hypothetical protein
MDAQTLINAGIAVAGFLGGWVLTQITKSLDKLDDDVKHMPEKYIMKADYYRDITDIKAMLKEIYNKIDNKADK